MHRSNVRKVAVTLILGSLSWAMTATCLAAADDSAGTGTQKPNFLLAIADDWGWPHAGAYGDPVVQTPTFDRLAREGVLFRHAYVSSPSCTPSRGALLTGQWHWRLREGANLHGTLPERFPVYPDLLEKQGYFVGHTGKAWGPGRVEPGGRTRNPAGPRFSSFQEFLENRPQGKPFCFWFGTSDPHRPYRAGSGVESGMDLAKIHLPACFPDHPTVRSDVADYYWEVQRFDREAGELVEQLRATDELQNTVVIMTGDHGMPFPRCKSNLYDTGTRVPLAIRWPEKFPVDRKLDDLVSLTDVAPTILELAGVAVPDQMTGKSLVNILTSSVQGQADGERDFVLTGKERHVACQEAPESGGTPMRAIRTNEFLYIRNFEPDRWPAGVPDGDRCYLQGRWYGDIDNGPTKTFMYENRDDPAVRQLFVAAFEKRPAEELYDLRKDPEQLANVADEAEYFDAKRQLSGQLIEELRKTGDPRVVGGGEKFDDYPYYGRGTIHPSVQ